MTLNTHYVDVTSVPTMILSDCADTSSVPDDSARAMSPVAR